MRTRSSPSGGKVAVRVTVVAAPQPAESKIRVASDRVLDPRRGQVYELELASERSSVRKIPDMVRQAGLFPDPPPVDLDGLRYEDRTWRVGLSDTSLRAAHGSYPGSLASGQLTTSAALRLLCDSEAGGSADWFSNPDWFASGAIDPATGRTTRIEQLHLKICTFALQRANGNDSDVNPALRCFTSPEALQELQRMLAPDGRGRSAIRVPLEPEGSFWLVLVDGDPTLPGPLRFSFHLDDPELSQAAATITVEQVQSADDLLRKLSQGAWHPRRSSLRRWIPAAAAVCLVGTVLVGVKLRPGASPVVSASAMASEPAHVPVPAPPPPRVVPIAPLPVVAAHVDAPVLIPVPQGAVLEAAVPPPDVPSERREQHQAPHQVAPPRNVAATASLATDASPAHCEENWSVTSQLEDAAEIQTGLNCTDEGEARRFVARQLPSLREAVTHELGSHAGAAPPCATPAPLSLTVRSAMVDGTRCDALQSASLVVHHGSHDDRVEWTSGAQHGVEGVAAAVVSALSRTASLETHVPGAPP
jgi:hypothetical protein